MRDEYIDAFYETLRDWAYYMRQNVHDQNCVHFKYIALHLNYNIYNNMLQNSFIYTKNIFGENFNIILTI